MVKKAVHTANAELTSIIGQQAARKPPTQKSSKFL